MDLHLLSCVYSVLNEVAVNKGVSQMNKCNCSFEHVFLILRAEAAPTANYT